MLCFVWNAGYGIPNAAAGSKETLGPKWAESFIFSVHGPPAPKPKLGGVFPWPLLIFDGQRCSLSWETAASYWTSHHHPATSSAAGSPTQCPIHQ